MMLKKSLLLLGFSVILLSCGKENDSYKISAEIDDVKDSTLVFLNVIEGRGLKPVDTTIAFNNSFSFSGKIDQKDLHIISIAGLKSSIGLILENEDINIKAYKDSLHMSEITGTKENELLNDYTETTSKLMKSVQKLRADYGKAFQTKDTLLMKQARQGYDSIIKQNTNFDTDFINNNPDAIMSVFVLARNLNSRAFDIEKVKELFGNMSEEQKNTMSGKNISEAIEKFEQAKKPVAQDSVPSN